MNDADFKKRFCDTRLGCHGCLTKAPTVGFSWPEKCHHGVTMEEASAAFAERRAKMQERLAALGKAPSLMQQAKNVSRAFLRWKAAGFPKRSRAETEQALSKCLGEGETPKCPHWQKHPLLRFWRCTKCGCSKIKHGWKTEHCPLGKW